jgi:hypothetical protein
MAAGLGFKTFTTGEVLTAGDTNGYLMQGVLVFASATARDAAITSPQEGQFAYLKDTNVTTYYTGSAWANLDTTGMTNPMTTTGDTIYSSSGSTPARLGIGSTGQVLTVAGGVPTWATPTTGTTFIGCSITNTSPGSQNISNTTLTAITFANESFDTDNFHSTSTNTSRITIPTGKTGYYQINGSVRWDTNTTGSRSAYIYKNGNAIAANSCTPSAVNPSQNVNIIAYLVAGDYIELSVYQNSTATRTILASEGDGTIFSVGYLGA